MAKKILIAAGTSEHKKEYAVKTISDHLKSKGITDVEVVAENVYTMDLAKINPNLIVLIGPKSFKTDVPVIDGTAYITKIASMLADTNKKIEAAITK